MEMTRRGFIAAMLAAAAAPAIVRPESLMRIVTLRPLDAPILTLFGDGITDDTAALQALASGGSVLFRGNPLRADAGGSVVLPSSAFLLSATLTISDSYPLIIDSCMITFTHTDGPVFDFSGSGSGSAITNCHIRARVTDKALIAM